MISRILSVFFFCLLAQVPLSAQNIFHSLEQTGTGQGTITLHQDSRLRTKIESGTAAVSTSEGVKVIKSHGYRIQVYAGNNSRTAKNEAESLGNKVKVFFPEMGTYTMFISPRWLCRVGDFRSIEEANSAMRQLRATGAFQELSIIKGEINIFIK
jgi:hypothetical protein